MEQYAKFIYDGRCFLAQSPHLGGHGAVTMAPTKHAIHQEGDIACTGFMAACRLPAFRLQQNQVTTTTHNKSLTYHACTTRQQTHQGTVAHSLQQQPAALQWFTLQGSNSDLVPTHPTNPIHPHYYLLHTHHLATSSSHQTVYKPLHLLAPYTRNTDETVP